MDQSAATCPGASRRPSASRPRSGRGSSSQGRDEAQRGVTAGVESGTLSTGGKRFRDQRSNSQAKLVFMFQWAAKPVKVHSFRAALVGHVRSADACNRNRPGAGKGRRRPVADRADRGRAIHSHRGSGEAEKEQEDVTQADLRKRVLKGEVRCATCRCERRKMPSADQHQARQTAWASSSRVSLPDRGPAAPARTAGRRRPGSENDGWMKVVQRAAGPRGVRLVEGEESQTGFPRRSGAATAASSRTSAIIRNMTNPR